MTTTDRYIPAVSAQKPEMVDIYWAAGFLEGEGCFHGNESVVSVDAHQVHKPPLDLLVALLGGSLLPSKAYNRNAQQAWRWRACGGRAIGIMLTLYSLLSPKRRAEITSAMQKYKPLLKR